MVLHSRGCGRVARRRILSSDLLVESLTGFPEGPFLFPHTGVFLHSVEENGRREARGRDDSSTHWVFCSAGRPVGGRIAPVTGSPGTLGDPRNFRGASCPYPMVE